MRLLSEQLAASPLLLGPRTPGALAGALGRFLACGSPELQVRARGGLFFGSGDAAAPAF